MTLVRGEVILYEYIIFSEVGVNKIMYILDKSLPPIDHLPTDSTLPSGSH